jgi:hypothetical protein
MLAPYKTDSRVGRRDTDIDGRQLGGRNRDEYHDISQTKMGVAGIKNWLVNGMRSTIAYNIGIASL